MRKSEFIKPVICIIQQWIKNHTTFIFLLSFLFVAISILKHNLVNPLSWTGRTLHVFLLALILLVIPLSAFLRNRRRDYTKSENIVIVFICIMLLAETTSRFVPRIDAFALNPGVRYFWPDWYFPKNNIGHKDRDVLIPKPYGVFRIAFYGDSFTEGAGLEKSESFPRLVERLITALDNKIGSVESINFGHSGMNTKEEVQLVIETIHRINPDLAVLTYVLNDAELHPPRFSMIKTPRLANYIHQFFLGEDGSYLYYWLFNLITIWETEWKSAINVYKEQHADNSEGWKNLLAAMENFRRVGSQENTELLGVIFPMFQSYPDPEYPSELRIIHAKVTRAFESYNIPVIDLLPFYEKTGRHFSDFMLTSFDGHPNADAAYLAAGKIVDWIITHSNSYQDWQHNQFND